MDDISPSGSIHVPIKAEDRGNHHVYKRDNVLRDQHVTTADDPPASVGSVCRISEHIKMLLFVANATPPIVLLFLLVLHTPLLFPAPQMFSTGGYTIANKEKLFGAGRLQNRDPIVSYSWELPWK